MDDPVKKQQAADDLAKLTANPTPSLSKEIEHFESGRPQMVEKPVEVVEEIPENPEEEKIKEVEGYVEKVEKEAELHKSLADDYVASVGMTTPVPQNPKVTLPLTDEQIQLGLHHKVWEGIRWLAEWCVRQMKMLRK